MTDTELSSLSIDDIDLILEDQADLYSPEELEQLRALKRYLTVCKQKEAMEKRAALRLSTVICPKCDGPNDAQRSTCQYCSHPFKEEDYYAKPNAEPSNGEGASTEDGGSGFPLGRTILGLALIIGGTISVIHGTTLNDDFMRQLEHIWNTGRTNPGTIWIIVGAVAITLGIVSLVSAILSRLRD